VKHIHIHHAMALILHILAAAGLCSTMAMRTSSSEQQLEKGLPGPGTDFDHASIMSTMKDGKCMDFSKGGNVFMNDCNGSPDQLWYFKYGAVLSVKLGCLEATGTNIKKSKKCYWEKKAKFYWDGQRLRARSGVLPYCLEYDVKSSNVKLGICKKDKKTQQWRDAEAAIARTTTTTTIPHLRTFRDFHTCLDYDTSDGHLFVNACSESDTQLWYRTSDGFTKIKNKADPNKCLIVAYSKNSKPRMADCATEMATTDWEAVNDRLVLNNGYDHCLELDPETKTIVMGECTSGYIPQAWLGTNDENLHLDSCCKIPIA